MRAHLKVLFLLVLFPLIAGCGFLPAQETEPASLPTALPTGNNGALPSLTGDWQVQFNQSGGFAGLSRSLEISSTGALTIDDGRSGVIKTAELSAETLDALTRLAAQASFQPDSQTGGCADCFIYSLQITTGGAVFQARVDEVALSESGLQELVDFMLGLFREYGG